MGFNRFYPLVICYITIERSTLFLMGKSTISMAIFNSYVKLPEGIYLLIESTVFVYNTIVVHNFIYSLPITSAIVHLYSFVIYMLYACN